MILYTLSLTEYTSDSAGHVKPASSCRKPADDPIESSAGFLIVCQKGYLPELIE